MFMAGELIDVVQIDLYKINSAGYINSLKIQLEENNAELIDLSEEEPQFFIEPVASAMNNRNHFLKN